ncbi:hypothetical protein FSW04_21375 [Baekduia soli]|uniref:Uncharacterized protein n=1 Tax=Baekduia soli TaxID=496014 RepID=A0A5B8U9M5_9ACTN|nr:hypothetical protein [Baekduia soli]QEC49866.1 hypothetical protein FSW04_21375 [Baekduia soli]
MLLTVPLSITGTAAPILWLLVTRTIGLAGLGLVLRLATRQGGAIAGAAAVALLAAAPGWWPTLLGGGIEPVVVTLGCCALAAHRAGRPLLVIALLSAMALGREEALLMLVAYGVMLRRRGRRWILAVVGASSGVLAAWLGGDWLGSGDPWRGAELARAATASPTSLHGPALGIAVVATAVVVALAVVGVAAAWRARNRAVTGLAASAMAWAAVDLALSGIGYPLPARFLLPAAAAAAVTAGTGLAVLLRGPGAVRSS